MTRPQYVPGGNPPIPANPEAETVRVAGRRFAESVAEMFTDDPNWSVLDLDGAAEFFMAVDYAPPLAAMTVKEDAE